MSVAGSLVAILGFLYAIVIIFAKIFGNVVPHGWAPIMVVVLVLSGIQMLMIGVVGEYLWRVLDQVRNRQPYIIEKIYD
jgi:dolichol-phosphate mannosyltransferase